MKDILYTSSSQDNGKDFFLVGTHEGCTIYQVDLLTREFKKGFNLGIEGEFSMVKMYKCSNIFGIVGSNNNLKLKKNVLIIWDDCKGKIIYKYKFKNDILNMELTEDSIVVVCHKKIYVFDIKIFQLVDIITTGPNPKSIVAINKQNRKIIVYPSAEENQGKLTIKNYQIKNYIYLNPMSKKEIDYFALSNDGLILAILGKETKKIRIYETSKGYCLDELTIEIKLSKEQKLEKDKKLFDYLEFSQNNGYIYFSYGKGDIDIFSLKKSFKNLLKILNFKNESININDLNSNIHKGSLFFNINKKDVSFKRVSLKGKEFKFVELDDILNLIFIITSNGKLHKFKFENDKQRDCLEDQEIYPLF